ncbi:hypothetical protein QBC33DRAFT_241373 [Phialemonium atrogriseum]|uniref:Uncharacterized protein n=1 Tax=Phialemonium atrogriseum TaxID=1093897 RepID=A0AAJ0FJZ2_9PEZI|nr:uncharacterized protein QBC33DRAFT_241373 [Phialemonium atrogriseum]KAK1763575.1 hypothetical protein QBC33DRAFT_241373 [Phialemonium atrogriseum]
MALLNATTKFRFYSDMIVQPRDDAILTATKNSKPNLNHQSRVRAPDMGKASGVAVVTCLLELLKSRKRGSLSYPREEITSKLSWLLSQRVWQSPYRR